MAMAKIPDDTTKTAEKNCVRSSENAVCGKQVQGIQCRVKKIRQTWYAFLCNFRPRASDKKKHTPQQILRNERMKYYATQQCGVVGWLVLLHKPTKSQTANLSDWSQIEIIFWRWWIWSKTILRTWDCGKRQDGIIFYLFGCEGKFQVSDMVSRSEEKHHKIFVHTIEKNWRLHGPFRVSCLRAEPFCCQSSFDAFTSIFVSSIDLY